MGRGSGSSALAVPSRGPARRRLFRSTIEGRPAFETAGMVAGPPVGSAHPAIPRVAFPDLAATATNVAHTHTDAPRVCRARRPQTGPPKHTYLAPKRRLIVYRGVVGLPSVLFREVIQEYGQGSEGNPTTQNWSNRIRCELNSWCVIRGPPSSFKGIPSQPM